MKRIFCLALCLLMVFGTMGSVFTEAANAMPAAPTDLHIVEYNEDYVAVASEELFYGDSWKKEYKVFLLEGKNQWTDVTDKCMTNWQACEMHYMHSLRSGQSVTLAFAPYIKEGGSVKIGEKVVLPAFTYKTGKFKPIQNLKVRFENHRLQASWDAASFSGFSFSYYMVSVRDGTGKKDPTGAPQPLYGETAMTCSYSGDIPVDAEKLIVEVQLCLNSGGKMYTPKAAKASVRLRKVKDGYYTADGEGTVQVTSITLNKTEAVLKKGKTLQLKAAKILPADATDKKVKWTSSDKKVATVSSKGKVKAKKKGTCIITCTAADGSGVTATCRITVK